MERAVLLPVAALYNFGSNTVASTGRRVIVFVNQYPNPYFEFKHVEQH